MLTTYTAILGATNPLASAPGTIRGDYAIVRSCSSHRHASIRTNRIIGRWP